MISVGEKLITDYIFGHRAYIIYYTTAARFIISIRILIINSFHFLNSPCLISRGSAVYY